MLGMVIYFVVSIGTVLLYILGKEQWLCLYPIQAGCLFLIASQPIRGEISKSLCSTCRNMSSAIYFLHIVFIYGIIDPVFGVDSPIIMKFSVSVLFSIVVLLLLISWQVDHEYAILRNQQHPYRKE